MALRWRQFFKRLQLGLSTQFIPGHPGEVSLTLLRLPESEQSPFRTDARDPPWNAGSKDNDVNKPFLAPFFQSWIGTPQI